MIETNMDLAKEIIKKCQEFKATEVQRLSALRIAREISDFLPDSALMQAGEILKKQSIA